MSLAMTVNEREAFLAGLHVGVLSVAAGDGRAPLAIPIWYLYEPGGEVRFSTGQGSRKVRLLREAGRASLCVQTEDPPYRYVTVEGPALIEESISREERLALAVRYLGPEVGAAWLAANDGPGSVLIRLKPDRWVTADFGKAGG
jgi:PPOX class probable F420-dependent enzyme